MLSKVQNTSGIATAKNFHYRKGHGKLLSKWLAANLCRWQRRWWAETRHAPPSCHHPLYAQFSSLVHSAIYFARDQSEMCNEIANYI